VRTVIVGNSGSGKSTLARALAREHVVPILDLDTVAWLPDAGPVPKRRPIAALRDILSAYCDANPHWIIEGCYGDAAEILLARRPELIWLEPGEATCLAHCRDRPWESHKYASKAAQDTNLDFLLNWVRDYYRRDDDCSYRRHRAIFDAYDGPKRLITSLDGCQSSD